MGEFRLLIRRFRGSIPWRPHSHLRRRDNPTVDSPPQREFRSRPEVTPFVHVVAESLPLTFDLTVPPAGTGLAVVT